MVGGRPKPSPCLKLYSFLQAKSSMPATVTVNGEQETYTCPAFESSPPSEIAPPTTTLLKGSNTAKVNDLAFTRSGDKVEKAFYYWAECITIESIRLFVENPLILFDENLTQGNSCNIGVIARNPAFLPYLRDRLTEEVVAEQFKHCFEVLTLSFSRFTLSFLLPS